MKKFLITGGFGFIGSNLTEFLVEKNNKVIIVDYLKTGSNKKNVSKNKLISFYKVNICDKKKIGKILNKHKPDIIFNLAAESHVDRSIENPKIFFSSNTIGVFNLLECLRNYYKVCKKIKFIHVSTDEVYGDIKKGQFSSETAPFNPSSPYASTKAASDLLVKSYYKTYNLPVIITNCSNNFGPRQYPEKLIPRLILNIFENKNLPIYGNGKNEREWIFVKDHCKALYKISLYGKFGENYNIGSNIVLKNLTIAKLILKISKKVLKKKILSKIIFVKDRPGHDQRYALNSSKIKKKLKINIANKISQQLEYTIKWYKNNYKWLLSIKNKKYHRRVGLI